MSTLTYTQFWPSIWGFQVGRLQRLSRPIAGIFWGCISAVCLVILLVWMKGKDGGRDAHYWAWIDVVWIADRLLLVILLTISGLLFWPCQTSCHAGQIYAASMDQLQTAVDGRMEH